jgi:nucleotide-binding universal stress UspA family protein
MTLRILLATDGSEGARTAGRLLAALPLPEEARVTVLSVVPLHTWRETLARSTGSQLVKQAADLTVAEETAARQTAETAALLLRERGVQTDFRVCRQSPADGILDQAHEGNASLIVLGSHGMGAIERFLIGSVAERVARYAPCSVLVARRDTLRRTIIAVDGSQSAEHALDTLIDLPLPIDVELTAVYAVQPVEVIPAVLPIPPLNYATVVERYEEERRKTGERILLHARERLRAAGRHVTVALRWGSPADELLIAARETNADLIVVGAANRSPLGRLFMGSVSGRVLSHATSSVFVARREG